MRKCGSCGYLLLGEGEFCGRCGTPLSVATPGAVAGAPQVSPSPLGRLSIPLPAPAPSPTPPPPPPPAYGGPPLTDPSFRAGWQPAVPPVPTKPARSTRVGRIALGVMVALAVGLGATHLGSDALPSGTGSYVDGGGVAYTSPDGAYQARFPTTPTVDQVPLRSSSGSLMLDRAMNSTGSYEVAVASAVDMPIAPGSADVALAAGLAAEAANLKSKLDRQEPTTFAGRPAIEGRLKTPDGYQGRILLVQSGSAFVELFVHARTGVDRLYRAAKATLIVR